MIPTRNRLLCLAAATLLGSAASGGMPGGPPLALEAQERTVTLEEAVARALDRSPELRDARLAVTAAGEQVTEARGRLYPQVDLSFRYTRNVTPPAAFLPALLFDPDAGPDELLRIQFEADNVWSTAVHAELPLFDGRALAGVRASSRHVDLQDEVLRGRSHEVITRVRTLYYDLLLAQERERLAVNSLERVRASLEETRALEDAGLASEYDVLRLEVEVANLEPAVHRARNARAEGARELAVVLGMEEEAHQIHLTGSLAEMVLDDLDENTSENRAILAFTGTDPDDLDGEALRDVAGADRSELRQLELEADLREAELRSEQAGFLPRVSIFGTYDVRAQQDGSPDFFGTSAQRGYGRMVGVQVTIPIFAGFQRTARADRVRTQVQQSRTRRDALAERTDADVRSLLERVEEARTRARGQERAVRQAERGYEIVRAEFAEGLASQFEVTDAEVALRQSETNYAEAVHDYLVARAELDRVTGRVPGVGGR